MEQPGEQKTDLHILTCLKQVRQPQSALVIEEGRASWPGPALWKMGSADEFALEEALAVKDARAGTQVTALSLGPERAQAILRRALGMGADRAMHLLSEQEPRQEQVAALIAAWAWDQAPDLILTGVMSEDAMAGLVGPLLAGMLDLPLATAVVALEPDADGRGVRVEREMEGGRRQALWLPLPALLTIGSSARPPRYPTLSGLLRAKQAALPSREAASLARPSQREEGLGLTLPRRARAGLVLQGTSEEKAARLLAILKERALL